VADPWENRLAQTRTIVANEIRQPEMSGIRQRAAQIRRRRRVRRTAASALALVLLVGLGLATRAGGDPAPVASPDPAVVARWQGGGLTLVGTDTPVLELAGDLTDVQFAGNLGYALAADCGRGAPTCPMALAGSVDGGRTWTRRSLPFTNGASVATLLPVGDALFIRTAASTWYTPDARGAEPQWRTMTPDPTRPLYEIPAGARLTVEPPDGAPRDDTPDEECGGRLTAWAADGTARPLADQPSSVIVCSVSADPSEDGSWWFGGRTAAADAPAVGRTRDGQAWETVPLPPGDGLPRLTSTGTAVYATVAVPRGGNPYPETSTIRGVWRASVWDVRFTSYLTDPATVIGDVVPLADGRLVLAGPQWSICPAGADSAGAAEPAGGSLPTVYRLARTQGLWVAYNLFGAGWAATSRDGETWTKLTVR
jgi:hypothetical protein